MTPSHDVSRRVFRYVMDAPMADFYSFLSARYAVRKATWRGPVCAYAVRDGCTPRDTTVAIEVYYQPGHEYNVDRMITAVQKTLAYATAHFGPYQHRQVRILEFPRYATFAQSFPNTIPFSEGIGFITEAGKDDVTGEDLMRETIANADERMSIEARLGFGHADVVVAVPEVWHDVTSMGDLDDVAAEFRQRHGRRLRIATKYWRLTQQFFSQKHGIQVYRIVESLGATEGAPAAGSADRRRTDKWESRRWRRRGTKIPAASRRRRASDPVTRCQGYRSSVRQSTRRRRTDGATRHSRAGA